MSRERRTAHLTLGRRKKKTFFKIQLISQHFKYLPTLSMLYQKCPRSTWRTRHCDLQQGFHVGTVLTSETFL